MKHRGGLPPRVIRRRMKPIPNAKKLTKEQLFKEIRRQRDRDSELVTGIFKNFETPGGTIEFMYKMYPQQENCYYILTDGERYKLPRGVWAHLSQNCFYLEHKHLPGEAGQTGVRQAVNDGSARKLPVTPLHTRKVYRFGFMPLEFVDDGEFVQPDIVQVTAA